MVNLFFSPFWSPKWFAGFDLAIELLCMIVAIIITAYSYKIFKFIKEKKYFYFSLAFFFISGAFFVRVAVYALNFLIHPPATLNLTQEMVRELAKISALKVLGTFIPIILMLAAFMVLISISLNIKEKKVISLLFILSFISSFLGVFLHQAWYYIISFTLLAYISNYFLTNYKQKRTSTSLVVFVSFAIFALSQFMFVMSTLHRPCYVIAEIVQLVSFVMLLVGFILVLKK